MKGGNKIRAYASLKQWQMCSSGNWYTKGRKARIRRIFKKGARQAGKVDIAERLRDGNYDQIH